MVHWTYGRHITVLRSLRRLGWPVRHQWARVPLLPRLVQRVGWLVMPIYCISI